MRKSARRVLITVWAGTLIALCGLGAYLLRELLESSGVSTTSQPTEQVNPSTANRLRTITLYFGATNGRGLTREQRQVHAAGKSTHELMKTVLQELVQGPSSVLVPTVPDKTTVNSMFLLDTGELVIDFGKEIQAYHPGSAFCELMTVYSITNTLAANFDEISSVRFLVDGSEVETLTEYGHVDLTEPVVPDQTWISTAGGLRE